MAEVVLDRVSKVYGGDTVALRGMNLVIPEGEFVVFVGPSGCGKSTALRLIAGLEGATEGGIYIGDRMVNDLPPGERDVAMVFQSYALYPHMNVRDNLAFALRLQGMGKREIGERVGEAAGTLGIEELLERRPKALSGGQRQRVALGRAIVREPAVFLMDEPLSNLDAKLRVQMRTEISTLQQRLQTTTIYVTHDQTEAMTMADRVVVLKDGEIQQVATPQRIYDRPENTFVAGFMGSPAMNLVRGRVERREDRFHALFGGTSVPLSGEARRGVSQYAGKEVIVGVRPERVEDARFSPRNGESGYIEAKPTLVEGMGSEKYVHFGLCGESLVARVSAESGAVRGETMGLTIDSRKIHLFDPESGEAIL